jgi:hypothetical protein
MWLATKRIGTRSAPTREIRRDEIALLDDAVAEKTERVGRNIVGASQLCVRLAVLRNDELGAAFLDAIENLEAFGFEQAGGTSFGAMTRHMAFQY